IAGYAKKPTTDMKDLLENESVEITEKYLKIIPEDLQIILRLRFLEKMTLQQIGNRLGMTRERVRQREAKGLRMLRCRPSQLNDLYDALENFNEPEMIQ